MAIKRPAIYEHNNPNLPIVDSDFVRGGSRSAVQTLNDLYALTGKASQLKQHSTQIYVSGENKIYLLKDSNNIGNSNGWEEFNFGGGTNVVYTTGDQTISGRKEFSGTVFSPFLTTRPSSIPKSPTFITLTDNGGNVTGTRHGIPFTNSSQDQEALSNFINSQSWVISGRTGFANPYNLLTPTLVNNTGVIDIPIASGTNFIYEFTTFTVENKFKKIEKSGVFALLSGEKIGIGTLNPTEKAHIVGNLKLDGQLQTSLLPTVNGTGVLLSGEVVAQLPNTIVYNTGNQTISGNKTFQNSIFYGLASGSFDLGLRTNISSGSGASVSFTRGGTIPSVHGYGIVFEGGSIANKKGYLTVGETVAPVGYQYASLDWTSRILSGAWSASSPIRVGSAVSVMTTGDQTISGVKTFVSRPTVNGTGVLLSGEASQVDLSSTVRTTGNQTVSGVKAFVSRPTVSGTGVLLSGEAVESNGTINRMIKLTQAQYNALSPVDSTTFYVIVG
jgi:hypothetical protein